MRIVVNIERVLGDEHKDLLILGSYTVDSTSSLLLLCEQPFPHSPVFMWWA
jgi:hypothetical protein